MRRALLAVPVLALAAAVAIGARQGPPAGATRSAPESARDTLVRLDRAKSAAGTRLLRRLGGRPVSEALGVWRVPAGATATVRQLERRGLVESSEPDQPARRLAHLAAGDPLIRPWLTSVGADRAEPPGPGRPVTVIDSGLDLTHPEFANRPNTIALNEQRARGRDEEIYHGTAVSSLIGAPSNGLGLVGVYPQAVLKLWDLSATGLGDVISGIDAASRSGAGVINLSLGFDVPSKSLNDAVSLAFGRGSVIVAAAGNERQEGNPTEYPSYLPHVLTIAATNESATRVASFSNQTNQVDFAAPGQRIAVAVPTSYEESGFLNASGTSFSAPIASGATAWVWTARPQLDHTQIFEVMRQSARDVAPAGFDADTGFGMLDIPNALAFAAPAPDPQEPNEDVDLVTAKRVFTAAKPALTRPGVGRASLSARVDANEDPRDVYRVWVPARRSVFATLTPRGAVDLEAWRPTAASVTRGAAQQRTGRSARPGQAVESLRIRNTTRTGAYYFVNVLAAPSSRGAGYTLSLVSGTL